jgi:ATP-dependent protease Clp ATPase subunit
MKRLASLGSLLRRHPQRLRCSFCRREADAVERLVAGASAHICDRCIAKCVAVLEQHGGFVPAVSTETELPG